MKPSQAFGVAVRVVGLVAWLGSLLYVLSAITVLLFPNYRPDAGRGNLVSGRMVSTAEG
jgi:hypothetical protein